MNQTPIFLLPNEEKTFVARPNKSLSIMALIFLSRPFFSANQDVTGLNESQRALLHER